MIDFDKPLCIPTIAVKVELVKDSNGQPTLLKLIKSHCSMWARLVTISGTARFVAPNGKLVNEFGNEHPYGGHLYIENKKEPEKDITSNLVNKLAGEILTVFNNYLYCAREIDDLKKEDDYGEFVSAVKKSIRKQLSFASGADEPGKVNNKEVREGKGYFKLKVGKYPYWMECEFKHVIDDLWHVSGGFYTDSFNGVYSSDDFDCRMIK